MVVTKIKATAFVGVCTAALVPPVAARDVPAVDTTDPLWLTTIERFGLSVFLVLFACIIAWRLVPHLITLIGRVSTLVQHLDEVLGASRKSIDDILERINVIERRQLDVLKAAGKHDGGSNGVAT